VVSNAPIAVGSLIAGADAPIGSGVSLAAIAEREPLQSKHSAMAPMN
jgi:hypothetical protein